MATFRSPIILADINGHFYRYRQRVSPAANSAECNCAHHRAACGVAPVCRRWRVLPAASSAINSDVLLTGARRAKWTAAPHRWPKFRLTVPTWQLVVNKLCVKCRTVFNVQWLNFGTNGSVVDLAKCVLGIVLKETVHLPKM